jgi:hypothetical protein
MHRCLIVANQTLNSQQLSTEVAQRIAATEHTFYVVVPATPLRHQAGGLGGPEDELSAQDRAYAVARQRLGEALDEIRQLGAEVDGEVGDADAFEAVSTALGRFEAQEVVVSTLPLGLSRWLRRDLPRRIERTFQVPVTQVISEPADRR